MIDRSTFLLALALLMPLVELRGGQDIELAPPLVLEHLGLSLRLPVDGVFEPCEGKRVLRHALIENGVLTRSVDLFIVSALTERGAPIPIEECIQAGIKEVAAGHAKAKSEIREYGSSALAVAGRGGRRTFFEVTRDGTPKGAGAFVVWQCEFPRAGASARPYYFTLLVRGKDTPAAIEALVGRIVAAIACVAPKSPAVIDLAPLRAAREYRPYGMALDLPLGWRTKEQPPVEAEAVFELLVAAYDYGELYAPQYFIVGVKPQAGGGDIFGSPELLEAYVRGISMVAAVKGSKLTSHRVTTCAGRNALEVVRQRPQGSRERLEVERIVRAGAWQYSLRIVQTNADENAARAKLDAFAKGFRLLEE